MSLRAPVTTMFQRSPASRRKKARTDQRRGRRRPLVLESLEAREVMDAALHTVAAALIDVVQNDTGNAVTSVTATTPYAMNGFQVRAGSNRGDYNVQIGSGATGDPLGGVLMTSVAQNGRDNSAGGDTPGLVYANSMLDADASGYFVPIHNSPAGSEWNINTSAAWFSYADWLGGWVKNSANNAVLDQLIGSPSLQLGTHVIGQANGQTTINLTSLGINSQTDGVLLVTGGKNEDNYALSAANADGTWTVFCKDNGSSGAGLESDPVAFVYVPKSDPRLISGKFSGDASIGIQSQPFTVTKLEPGRYQLEIPGQSPTTGVLLVSPESGATGNANFDNIVSYEAGGNGWVIETRDIVNSAATPVLEEIPAAEFVTSFVFLPGPTPGFSVTPTSGLLTTEGEGTASFTVVLDTQPTADVTIGVSSSNPAEGLVAPASLTFTSGNWNQPQTVTVTGQDDAVVDGPVAYTVVLEPAVSGDPSYAGRDPADVAVVNADNESGVTVSPLSGLVTGEGGATATFTVRLNTQPTADVSLGLSSSNTAEGAVSPANLTFTAANWNVPQMVTVTGVDDVVDDGDVAYTIVTGATASADPTYNGLDPLDVAVTNLDNDTAGVAITPADVTTTEAGGTAALFVVLTSRPAADVTVTLASTDPTEGAVAPGSVTFTAANWNVPQTATVTGQGDALRDGDIEYAIVSTVASADPAYDGLTVADIAATNLDDEPVVSLTLGSLQYAIGMSPMTLDSGATIVDPVSPDYATGTLTVTLTNADAGDRLGIRNAGTGAGQVGVAGSDITYGGTVVGGWSGGAGAAPLVVTFNAAATPAVAQAVLRAVAYHNVGSNPSRAPRTASVVLTTGHGGTSNTATRDIQLTLVRVMDFQEGVDFGFGTYTGAADIQVSENAPTTSFPQGSDGAGLLMDWPDAGVANAAQVLLRFDNLFGSGPNQIPPGATIASAELSVTINNTGDGGTVHRMLLPWDADNETWNSLGSAPWNVTPGVQTDGVEARFAYDSQLGLVDGTGATGTGTVSLGVTPDLQAWANGEGNHGWLFTGWTDRTDGTQFSPTESANPAVRPRLRVTWLPAGTPSTSFRQGTDGYFGAVDTQLSESDPFGDLSSSLILFVDAADNSNESQTLMQFGELVGTGAGQIPAGSQIHSAVLTLGSTVGDAMGDGGRFYPLLTPWTEGLPNWGAWVNGVQPNGVEAAATYSVAAGNASLNPDVQGAFNPFDVTADVQAWVSGTRENYGWAIVPWPGGTNGWGFASSEAFEGDPALGMPNERPQLRVFFTAPGITVEPTAGLLTSEAGRTAGFAIQLDTPPAADVTIALSSSNPDEGTVWPASLTFTPANWNLPQTVSVTGVDDAVVDGSVTYTIVTAPAVSTDSAYHNLDAADVAALNLDNDSAGIAIEPLSGLTTSEAGGTATFSVALTYPPTADVTIGLSSSDASEGTVSAASVVFTPANWSVAQIITVTGVDDPQIDGLIAYAIVTEPAVSTDANYSGLDADDVPAINLDNDAAGFLVAPLSGLVTTELGGTATFLVSLTAEPTDIVSFGLYSTNENEGAVAPGSLSFGPGDWNVPQTVTVTGVNDSAEDGAVPYTIVLDVASSSDANFNGLNPADVSVTNLDVNPKVTLPSGETRYGIGDGGIGIDGRAMVVDLDSATFNGGLLTIQLTANGTADDRLEIRNEGVTAGQIGVSGGTVSYGGVAIGTLAGGTGTTPLTVALNAAATPAATQALLRAVTFRNVSPAPSLSPRTVQVSLTDDTGATSVPASKTLSVGEKRVFAYQEGVDHGFRPYAGTADIQLFQGQPGIAFPTGNSNDGLMVVADPGTNNSQVLLRFDNLFGAGPGQIPAGSLITSATLVLDVNNSGSGPLFHRMLTGWDATAETWTAFGNAAAPRNAAGGVQADDAEARSAFDSTLNVAAGNAAGTGTGSISLAVTADVQAWSNGAANHGWVVLPALASSTDNFAFSPAEAVNLADRPLLRVEWVPADARVASFRQGVNGYTGTADTQLNQNATTANNSASVSLFSDWTDNATTPNETQVLLRFDEIIGGAAAQVPPGATVHAAVLTLPGMDSANSPGDGGKFHTLLVPWADTDSWSTSGDGVQASGIEASTAYSAQAGNADRNPNAQAGIHAYDVTGDVAQWVSGARTNYGWAILPWSGGSDGWAISSAETANPAHRPQLSIYFTPPPGIRVDAAAGLTTSEQGGTASFSVVLNTKPLADVTIDLSSSDTTEGTVSPASLVFTPGNWDQPQIVTVTGVDDVERDGDVAYAILTAAASSADPGYQGLDAADVPAINTDDDTPGIAVVPTSGLVTTEYAGAANFTVVLTGRPTADVFVSLASDDATEGTVAPASLTFTAANWDTPQTATVTGVDDVEDDGDVAYTVVTTVSSADADYDGLAAADVSLTNQDNDQVLLNEVSVNPPDAPDNPYEYVELIGMPGQALLNLYFLSVEGDGSNAGTIDWVVNLSAAALGANGLLVIKSPSGGFSIPAETGVVTHPLFDNLGGGLENGTNSFVLVYCETDLTAFQGQDLDADNDGNVDTLPVPVTILDAVAWTDGDAGDRTYGGVTLTQSTGTPDAATRFRGNIAPQSFSAWYNGDLTGTTDSLVYDFEKHSANFPSGGELTPGAANGPVIAAGINVSPTSGLATDEAGGASVFSVALSKQPLADVTVGLSSGDPTEGAVTPASLTFTPFNWATPQTVVVTGVDDPVTDGDVAYTIVTAAAVSHDAEFNGLDAADVSVTNTDNESAGILVTPSVGLTTTEAGGAASFTIVLTTAPTDSVVIDLSSSNTAEGTVAPASLTFTVGDWASPQTVTVTGVDDGLLDGSVAYTIVTAPAVSNDLAYAGLNAIDVSATNADDDTAGPHFHSVVAANLNVVQNDPNNNTTSVTVTVPLWVNDFFLPAGSNRGDFNFGAGVSATDDVAGGILLTSVSENGRDNTAGGTPGLQYATSHIDGTSSYFIPVASSPGGAEFNINVATGWFPYDQWLGGWAMNSGGTGVNGGANNLLSTVREITVA